MQINRNQGICQALRSEDAPFIIAIGACVLSSLVYAKKEEVTNHNPKGSPLGTDDVRNGAMTIISFIPIFNWLVCLLIFLLALTFYVSVVSDLHIQLFSCA